MHQNILQIKLGMNLSTQAVPMALVFSRSNQSEGEDDRILKTPNYGTLYPYKSGLLLT